MSPRSPQQIESIRAKSKQRILDAAFELMARNGYESTSISQIAAKANISKGLLYNYFKSKEDVLETLVYTAFSEGDKLMSEIIATEPEETLKNLFKWYFNELRERPELWKLITALSLQVDRFQFLREMVNKKMYEYAEFIGDLLQKQGIDNPKDEAILIGALFDGIGLQYIILRDDYPLDEMERFLINKYCNRKIK